MVSLNKSPQIGEEAKHQVAKEEKQVITAKGEQDKKSQIKSDDEAEWTARLIVGIIFWIASLIYLNLFPFDFSL